MNKELHNRLNKYSAAAAALAIGTAGANAQIIYTDVDPDFVHPGGNIAIGLDIDNDSNFDFIMASVDTTLTSGTQIRNTIVAPYGSVASMNAIAGETPSSYNYALALNMNDMIDNTLNWISATNTMAYNVDGTNPYNENWNGVTDKYLGLRFSTGGNTYYGWARLDVTANSDEWTLKDYAYESSADTGIAAGDGTVGLDDAQMDQLVHFINQQNNSVLVKAPGLTDAQVTVVSAMGAIVAKGEMENGLYTVNMNGLTSGIYMINVNSTEGAITKKMMVN